MKDKKTSVRTNAEAANCTIPTFDEVYADPYVQDCLRFLIQDNSIRYPGLASYSDDIRQEMLLYLLKHLHAYNPQKAGIKTFCRHVLESGLRMARRRYLADAYDGIAQATPLHEMPDGEPYRSIDLAINSPTLPLDVSEERNAILAAIKKLSPGDQIVANAIMDGLSTREIIRRRLCSCSQILLYRVFPRIRAALEQNFF